MSMCPSVDGATCIGCGTCPSLAPEVFQMGSEGKAEIVPNCDCEGKDDVIKQAKEACPVQAIS